MTTKFQSLLHAFAVLALAIMGSSVTLGTAVAPFVLA